MTNLSIVKLMIMNSKRWHRIDCYDGNKISVLLRLPPQFVKNVERFIHETDIFKSEVDFYNRSIEYYMDALDYSSAVLDCIHHRDGNAIMNMNLDDFMRYKVYTSDPDSNNWDNPSTHRTEKEDWLDVN